MQSYQRFQHIVHTVFNTSGTNGPRSLSQVKVGTRSALLKGSHTRAHTPKHGRFGWGWYHYPRTVPHVHEHPRAGCQNGKLCRFWVLAGCALEGRRKPSGQRCAYACRCPEASRPRWAALSLPVIVHRRALGGCHRCDKGQRTLLAGLPCLSLINILIFRRPN